MIRWCLCGALWVAIGCGDPAEPEGTGTCEVLPQGVMVAIDMGLPAQLSASACSSAVYSELEAFVLLPDEASCFLELDEDGLFGCCPVQQLNRSMAATLVVRTAALQALVEATELLSIPSSGGTEVVANFDVMDFEDGMYDSDRDGTSNLDEYCEGSL